MTNDEITTIFEAFFEKYKKTEGDRSAWSAHWTETMPSGASVEINLTKCPLGTIFKVFKNGRKLGQLSGWDVFFTGVAGLVGEDWHPDVFFNAMREMI